jgi:hypothetical protein
MDNQNTVKWKPWQPSKHEATRRMEEKQRAFFNKRSDDGEVLKFETKEVIRND